MHSSVLETKKYTIINKIFTIIFIVFVQILLIKIGLIFSSLSGNASPIWPATGFAVGVLYFFGKEYLPALILAVFFGEFYFTHENIILSSGLTIGMTLEAISSLTILKLFERKQYAGKYTEVISIFIAFSIGAFFSALIGASSLNFLGFISKKDYLYNMYTWWSGDLIGGLIVFPFILQIYEEFKNKSYTLKLNEFLIFLLIFSCSLIFIYISLVKDYNLAFLWAICFLNFYLGLYSSQMMARILLILNSSIIVTLVLTGRCPIQFGDSNLSFLYIQLLLGSFSLSAILSKALKHQETKNYKFFLPTVLLTILTIISTFFLSKIETREIENKLNLMLAPAYKDFRQIEMYINSSLNAANTYFYLNPKMSETEWNSSFEKINLTSSFPFLNGIGFVKYIEKNTLNKSLNFKNLNDTYSNLFHNLFIITYIYPVEINKVVIGLNLGSEKTRREGLENSIKYKKIFSTKSIFLLQDKVKRPGFLIVNPIFFKDKIFGWTYSPVISEIFFDYILNSYNNTFETKIDLDEKTIYGNENLFSKIKSYSKYLISQKIDLFGIKYKLSFYPKDSFFKERSNFSMPISTLILILYFIAISIILEILAFSKNLERLVKARTDEIEQNKEQLIVSSKMASLGEMAAGIAHEINNPITIIKGKTFFLLEQVEQNKVDIPKLKSSLETISKTSDRISKIIRGLKSFSRNAEKDPMEPIKISLIIEDAISLCNERFKNNNVKLNVNCSTEDLLECRTAQITQVITNLLGNAFDAISSYSDKWITLDAQSDDESVTIKVTDCGNGIPKEIIDKIMQPFFTTKAVGVGTGLGLSISKGIIEDHKGTLRYDHSCKNTCFIIQLPLKQTNT